LRDLVLLRDFFHSFAISSALFFESLFAIDIAETTASWTIKDGGCRRQEWQEQKARRQRQGKDYGRSVELL